VGRFRNPPGATRAVAVAVVVVVAFRRETPPAVSHTAIARIAIVLRSLRRDVTSRFT
jgi:hypothetical protein